MSRLCAVTALILNACGMVNQGWEYLGSASPTSVVSVRHLLALALILSRQRCNILHASGRAFHHMFAKQFSP